MDGEVEFCRVNLIIITLYYFFVQLKLEKLLFIPENIIVTPLPLPFPIRR